LENIVHLKYLSGPESYRVLRETGPCPGDASVCVDVRLSVLKTHFSREDCNKKVASSKIHIQFHETISQKSYPISDQNGPNLYPISD